MQDLELFIDPSVFFDTQATGRLRSASSELGVHLQTTSELAPSRLGEISSLEFAQMQRKYGSWLPERRIPSREALLESIDTSEVSFYSWRESRNERTDVPFDLQSVESFYRLGWSERIDIDELWFSATHSTIVARIKARERALLQTLRRILQRGNLAAHLTVEEAPGSPGPTYRAVRNLGRWMIWLFYGAAIAGMLQPWIPWFAAGTWEVLVVSFKA